MCTTNVTHSARAYACEVKVDQNTAKVTINRFIVVDNFGNVINLMLVIGSVYD